MKQIWLRIWFWNRPSAQHAYLGKKMMESTFEAYKQGEIGGMAYVTNSEQRKVILNEGGQLAEQRIAELEPKAAAWDTFVEDSVKAMEMNGDQMDIEIAHEIKTLCERYGMASPF